MAHNIVIETHQMQDGSYRGYVVQGPMSALGWWSVGKSREATFACAASGVRGSYPTLALSLMHVET